MKSDHWNFLANLLGTPSPSEPPKKKAETAAKKEDERSSADQERQALAKPPADEPRMEEAGEPEQPTATEITATNILEALSASVPPQVLPGFGPTASDEPSEPSAYRESISRESGRGRSSLPDAGMEERGGRDHEAEDQGEKARMEAAPSDESGEESAEGGVAYESAWGELAAELGVEPTAPPPPRYSGGERSSEPVSREKERGFGAARSKPRRSEGGFGRGLGFEGNEEDLEMSRPTSQRREELEAEADDLGIDWRAPDTQPASRRFVEEPDQRVRDDSMRREPVHRREDREEEGEEGVRSDDLDSEGAPSRRRRRGRRGTRQRMGDEELRRPEGAGDDFPEARTERQGHERQSHERQGHERQGHERQGQGMREAGRREERRREEDRSVGGRERERYGSPATRRDVEDFDDFAGDLEKERPAPEYESDRGEDATPRSRTRRRGRRGRGRGRETDTARRIDHERPVSERIEAESAFDDDHEDDLEVEAIRRGRRSRSAEREREEGSREERADRTRTRHEEDDRSVRTRGRESGRELEEDDVEDDRSQRRSAIPTWLETVELLVNANIENHKKSKGSNRGRGGKRR